ncbi:MAG: hemolysin family protein, partial [Clostridiaceae bacterium]
FTAGQATKSFESRLAPLFHAVPLLAPYSETVAFVLITLIVSYFTLVFGELLPKRLALQKPEAIALGVSGTITNVSKAVKPFVKLLSGSTTFFAKLFGIHSDNIEEEISISEIRAKIEEGKERGVFNQTERDMLDGIFEFDNRLAREVMTPRTDVVLVDIAEEPDNIIRMVTNGRFTRLPVYEGDPDNIIGILVIKDLYREYINKGSIKDIRKIMRDIFFAPETKHIDDLFKQMQSQNQHLAVLIDEYGGFSGIVTIEDLLEEIVGNIFDEHDITFTEINRIGRDTYVVDGMVTVDQINDDLNLDLDTENADTIGGYFIEKLGRVPEKGDRIEDVAIEMEVLRIRGRRIKDLKIVKRDITKIELGNDEV